MLSDGNKAEIQALVKDSLNQAEEVWRTHGGPLIRSMTAADSAILEKAEIVQSRIPAFPFVNGDKPAIGTFIAMVADIRNSSKHLLCAINAKASQLERVYYETSALLPALERTISYEQGSVTEYLGDGVLALFHVPAGEEEVRIKSCYEAARNCIDYTLSVVNDELNKRYDLPELKIGVGLAYSKALVSLVGIEGARHAKVIGECVYRATQLSAGRNEIYADERLEHAWPQSKGGKLIFVRRTMGDVQGFLVSREE